MATKKECDRCGKQWTPSTFEKDTELATVEVRIPYSHGRIYSDRDQVNKSYELCQNCARTVHKVLGTKPTGHGIASGQHTTPTARIQREILGEPDE